MNPDIRINYQKLGSGAGIEQFTRGLVQFGASDAAMTDEQIAKIPAEAGVLLVPMTAGSVVLAYNLPAVADLKLSRTTYAGIFLGRITRWNDPAIAKDNPGSTLPALEISVVHRSDGSGTSYVFTQHLSAISGEWAQGPGKGTSVSWPVGIGAKGSDGVIAAIKQTEGAIGYIEYGFAFKTRMPTAILENKAGKLVRATVTSARAALAEAKLPDDLRAWVPDPAGDESYPIVTYTWVLVHKKYKDSRVAETLKSVITYGLTEGQSSSEGLGYIPLPAAVVERALKVTQQIGS
jgi:phosphate transport system substrate-binding protein